MKAERAAAAGVQPEDAVPLLQSVLVGVAVNHHIHTGKGGGYVPDIMHQEKTDAFDGKGAGTGEGDAPVVVARTAYRSFPRD